MNDIVRVKLTDKGYEFWADSLNTVLGRHGNITVSQLRKKADKYGYVEFVLWDLFYTFGPAASKGHKDLFTEIVERDKYGYLLTDWALTLLAN